MWQRRFWEHQLVDEIDFMRHAEYIYYNPVSHGLVKAPKDWMYSSFHRAIRWVLGYRTGSKLHASTQSTASATKVSTFH